MLPWEEALPWVSTLVAIGVWVCAMVDSTVLTSSTTRGRARDDVGEILTSWPLASLNAGEREDNAHTEQVQRKQDLRTETIHLQHVNDAHPLSRI